MSWGIYQFAAKRNIDFTHTKQTDVPEEMEDTEDTEKVKNDEKPKVSLVSRGNMRSFPGAEKVFAVIDIVIILGGSAVLLLGLTQVIHIPHWALGLSGGGAALLLTLDCIGLYVTRVKLTNAIMKKQNGEIEVDVPKPKEQISILKKELEKTNENQTKEIDFKKEDENPKISELKKQIETQGLEHKKNLEQLEINQKQNLEELKNKHSQEMNDLNQNILNEKANNMQLKEQYKQNIINLNQKHEKEIEEIEEKNLNKWKLKELQLQQEIDSQKNKYEEEIQKIKENKEELEREVKNFDIKLKNKVDESEIRFNEKKEEIKEAKNQLEEKANEIEKLNNRLKGLENQANEFNQLQKQYEELEKTNQENKQKIEELKNIQEQKNEQLDKENKELNKKLELKDEEIKKINLEKTEEIKQLNNQLKNQLERYEKIRNNALEFTNQTEKKIEEAKQLQIENEQSFKQEIEQQKSLVCILQEDCDIKDKNIQELKQNIENLNKENKNLKGQLRIENKISKLAETTNDVNTKSTRLNPRSEIISNNDINSIEIGSPVLKKENENVVLSKFLELNLENAEQFFKALSLEEFQQLFEKNGEALLNHHPLQNLYEQLFKVYSEIKDEKDSIDVNSDDFHKNEDPNQKIDILREQALFVINEQKCNKNFSDINELLGGAEDLGGVEDNDFQTPVSQPNNTATQSTDLSTIGYFNNQLLYLQYAFQEKQNTYNTEIQSFDKQIERTGINFISKYKLRQRKDAYIQKQLPIVDQLRESAKTYAENLLKTPWPTTEISKDCPDVTILSTTAMEKRQIKQAGRIDPIVNEIVKTERDFVNKLNKTIEFIEIIQKNYENSKATKDKQNIEKGVEILKKITNECQEILLIHNRILEILENKENCITWKNLLLGFERDLMRQSIVHIRQFTQLGQEMDKLKQTMDDNPIIINAIKIFDVQQNENDFRYFGGSKNMKFSALFGNFIIAPTQRFPRYQLLFADLIKSATTNNFNKNNPVLFTATEQRLRGFNLAGACYNLLMY